MVLVLIGNINSRRVHYTYEALKRIGITELQLISYSDIYNKVCDLGLILPESGNIRLESPSEFSEFEAQLSGNTAENPLPKGIIYDYNIWYQNFCELLFTIEKAAMQKNCRFINHPAAILLAFDKYRCKEVLNKAAISTTPVVGIARSYSELKEILRSGGINRAFLKPRYGSSASGVIAYIQKKSAAKISTTIELDNSDNKIYNSLKIRSYTNVSDISRIIDEVGQYELVVEKWVPKNMLENQAFDLRLFVINQSVKQIIVRTSNSAITNLHLGNKRSNPEQIKSIYPDFDPEIVKQAAVKAVDTIPGLFYAGVDIILSGKKCIPYVVEINAFGDLLLGDLYQGKTTYDIFAEEFRKMIHVAG